VSLKKNVIANYLGNGWNAVMGLVFIPLYIKYLGMEAYGLIGIFAVFQSSLAVIDAGMSPTLSREMSRFSSGTVSGQTIKDLLRSLESIGLIIAVIYSMAIISLSSWLATNWLNSQQLSPQTVSDALIITGLVLALRLFEGLYRGAIIGLQKQVLFNISNVWIVTIRNLGAVFVLKYLSPTIHAFFIWQGLTSLIAVCVFARIVYSNLPDTERSGQFSSSEVQRIWRFAAGIFLTSILAITLTQLDKLLLAKFLSLTAFGHYTLAATISSSMLLMVNPIVQAFYPKLVELQSAGECDGGKKVFHSGAQMITIVTGSITWIIFFFGEQLLFLWTGNPVIASEISGLLNILTLGTFLNSCMNMPHALQLSIGWSSFTAKISLIAVLILTPTLITIAPVYGAIGAAWIWVALNSGFLFIATHFIFRRVFNSEKLAWFINDIFKPFFAAGVVVFVFSHIKPDISNKIISSVFIALAGLSAIIASTLAANEIRKSFAYLLSAKNKTSAGTARD